MSNVVVSRKLAEFLVKYLEVNGEGADEAAVFNELRAALAAPTPEPVAWARVTDEPLLPQEGLCWHKTPLHTMPLYTTPPDHAAVLEQALGALKHSQGHGVLAEKQRVAAIAAIEKLTGKGGE